MAITITDYLGIEKQKFDDLGAFDSFFRYKFEIICFTYVTKKNQKHLF